MAKIDRVQEVSTELLVPYANNAKKHSKEQVDKIAESIKSFGFLSPCLIDSDYNIIAGHGRVMAALQLGLPTVPCVFIDGLSEAERRAYILADNRLTELGEWDFDLVQEELEALNDMDFNVELTGFELDTGNNEEEEEERGADPVSELPESKLYICAVSAFGTSSEVVAMTPLSQETADKVVATLENEKPTFITEKLVGVLNDL